MELTLAQFFPWVQSGVYCNQEQQVRDWLHNNSSCLYLTPIRMQESDAGPVSAAIALWENCWGTVRSSLEEWDSYEPEDTHPLRKLSLSRAYLLSICLLWEWIILAASQWFGVILHIAELLAFGEGCLLSVCMSFYYGHSAFQPMIHRETPLGRWMSLSGQAIKAPYQILT